MNGATLTRWWNARETGPYQEWTGNNRRSRDLLASRRTGDAKTGEPIPNDDVSQQASICSQGNGIGSHQGFVFKGFQFVTSEQVPGLSRRARRPTGASKIGTRDEVRAGTAEGLEWSIVP